MVCGQVNVPEVDNTALECDEFISSKCVVIGKESIALNLIGTENLLELVAKIEEVIEQQNKYNESLNTKYNRLLKDYKKNLVSISKLENRVTKLEKEIIILKAE